MANVQAVGKRNNEQEMIDSDESHTTNLDKKTCEDDSQTGQRGIIGRFTTGIYSLGSGAVGLGVGSIKWVASTTYTVGSGVVHTGISAASGAAGKIGTGLGAASTKLRGKSKDKCD